MIPGASGCRGCLSSWCLWSQVLQWCLECLVMDTVANDTDTGVLDAGHAAGRVGFRGTITRGEERGFVMGTTAVLGGSRNMGCLDRSLIKILLRVKPSCLLSGSFQLDKRLIFLSTFI